MALVENKIADGTRGNFDVENEEICVGEAFLTHDSDIVSRARQLTATFYLKRGFIQPTDVDAISGVMTEGADPHNEKSEYYVVTGMNEMGMKDVSATVRKILYDPEKGSESFPVMQYFDQFKPEFQKEINEVGLDRCVEISALARDPNASNELDALNLYKTIWQDALLRQGTDQQEDLWLMAASPALFNTFTEYFNGAIKKIGPELPYPGQVAIPAVVSPVEGFIDLVKNVDSDPIHAETRRFVVEFMLNGLDKDKLTDEIKQILEEKNFIVKTNTDEESCETSSQIIANFKDSEPKGRVTVKEALLSRKPELAFATFLIGYTALRTLAVKNGFDQPGDNVDWRAFLGIEIATTPPYAWAAGETIRSLKNPHDYSVKRRLASSGVFTGSLLAPYAYVAALGGEAAFTRPSVAVPMGIFSVLSAASAISKVQKARGEHKQKTAVTDTSAL